MVTIDATINNLKTLTQLLQGLEELGVPFEQIEQAVDDPAVMRGMARAIQFRPELPKRYNKAACRELIFQMLPGRYDGNGHPVGVYEHYLYDDDREWLAEPEQVRQLLKELPPTELQVVILRGGLCNGQARPVGEVAEKLHLKSGQVNDRRGRAKKIMQCRALELVEARKIEELAKF